jgi:hypothetical protein
MSEAQRQALGGDGFFFLSSPNNNWIAFRNFLKSYTPSLALSNIFLETHETLAWHQIGAYLNHFHWLLSSVSVRKPCDRGMGRPNAEYKILST